MKNHLLFAILFFNCSQNGNTQTWFAPDHRWTYEIDFAMSAMTILTMTVGQDTIIQGQVCKEVLRPGSPYLPRYVYEDSNRVFAFRNGGFNKIYDLNLNPGEGLIIPTEGGGFFQYQIKVVDTIVIGNQPLRRQTARYWKNGMATNYLFEIIERIGMIGSPPAYPADCSHFFPDESFCSAPSDGWNVRFICFEFTGGNYSPYNACTVNAKQVDDTCANIAIFPNPAIDQVELLSDFSSNQIKQTSLVDAQGRMLKIYDTLPAKIDFSTLPDGLYWIHILFENGQTWAKSILKSKH